MTTSASNVSASQAADQLGAPGFILASASPRRQELLAQIGLTPTQIIPADIDENPFENELPKPHAERLATEKAAKVAQMHSGQLILAADTVVACGKRILPKAEDEKTARACLKMLSGRRHRVISGISIITAEGKQHTKSVSTTVAFKRLSPTDIDHYIASDEWRGKAGGYAIQGLGAIFIRFISGSYSNVVGLPLFEVAGWFENHLKSNTA